MRRVNPSFPDYEISDDGRVFRVICRDGRARPGEIFGRVLVSGYRQFKLTNCHGEKSFVRANRLVAETFFGPPPSPEHHCAHNDGNRLNNRVSNLRWATAKENCADMELHGTKCKGSRSPRSVLTDKQVADARSSFTGKRGEIRKLAHEYGVPYSVMGRVLRNESYCNGDAKRASYRKLNRKQRAEIVDAYLYQGRETANALAAKCNRNPKYVAALLLASGYSALDRRRVGC